MTIASERVEIDGTVKRLLDNLSLTISSRTGRAGAPLRQQIGNLRANYLMLLRNGTFPSELLACFTALRKANVTLAGLVNVHKNLFAEAPKGTFPLAIVQLAIGYCLAAESRIVAAMTFVSRDDVDVMMATMKTAFDQARELAADTIDSAAYQSLTLLAGAVTSHLANTARPMPRMISFSLGISLPSLALSNLLYHSTDRYEELAAENHIIHPLFCQRELRGLSQ